MNYDGMIYRPPSEAYSLILQVTVGCAHNHCTLYNVQRKSFHVKPLREVEEDLKEARSYYGNAVCGSFWQTVMHLCCHRKTVYDLTFVQTVFSEDRAHYFLWNRTGYFAKIKRGTSGVT